MILLASITCQGMPRDPGLQLVCPKASIEPEKKDGPCQCHQESCRVSGTIPTETPSKKPAQKGPRNAEEHGDEDAPWVTSRRHEFG